MLVASAFSLRCWVMDGLEYRLDLLMQRNVELKVTASATWEQCRTD